MELMRELFLAMFFYDFKVGLIHEECFQFLELTYGNEATPRTNVILWFTECRRARYYRPKNTHEYLC